MDLLAGNYLYKMYINKENFSTTKSSSSVSIGNIIALLIGIYSAYLSWSCNSAEGTNIIFRIIWAFFAFIFGIFYLIFYYLVRSGACNTAKGKY